MDDLNAAHAWTTSRRSSRPTTRRTTPSSRIVGDVDTEGDAGEGRRKYFERDPAQPAPPPVDMTEPPQTEERRLDDRGSAGAAAAHRHRRTRFRPSSSPDDDALSVLGTMLSSGRSSRFYETIVRQKQLAANVGAFAPTRAAARACSASSARAPPGKRSPTRSGDRRRDRAGEDRTDRRLGDREGAQRRARRQLREQPRQLAGSRGPARRSTRCFTTTRAGSTRAPSASPR